MRVAAGIAGDDAALHEHPVGPILAKNAILGVPPVRPGRDGSIHHPHDTRPIIRVNSRDPVRRGRSELGSFVAEGRFRGVVPDDPIARHVPIPDHVVGRLIHELVPFVGELQAFLMFLDTLEHLVEHGGEAAELVIGEASSSRRGEASFPGDALRSEHQLLHRTRDGAPQRQRHQQSHSDCEQRNQESEAHAAKEIGGRPRRVIGERHHAERRVVMENRLAE